MLQNLLLSLFSKRLKTLHLESSIARLTSFLSRSDLIRTTVPGQLATLCIVASSPPNALPPLQRLAKSRGISHPSNWPIPPVLRNCAYIKQISVRCCMQKSGVHFHLAPTGDKLRSLSLLNTTQHNPKRAQRPKLLPSPLHFTFTFPA
jgi:hypothetical protein